MISDTATSGAGTKPEVHFPISELVVLVGFAIAFTLERFFEGNLDGAQCDQKKLTNVYKS